MLRRGQSPQALLCLCLFFFPLGAPLRWRRLQSWMHFDTVFFNQNCELGDLHLDPGLSGASHMRALCHSTGRETLAAAQRLAGSQADLIVPEGAAAVPAEVHRPPRSWNTSSTRPGKTQRIHQKTLLLLSVGGEQWLCCDIPVMAWGCRPLTRSC